MNKVCAVLSGVLVCYVIAGCSSKADSAIEEYIESMDAVAEALEKNAPEKEVKKRVKRFEDSAKALEDLKLSPEEGMKLKEQHKEELTKATDRFKAAYLKTAVKGMKGSPMSPFGGK